MVRYFLSEIIFCFTVPLNFEIKATGSTANRKRFTRAHNNSLTTGDIVVAPKTGTAVTLNSGTIKDTASATINSALVFTGVTAATVTTIAP